MSNENEISRACKYFLGIHFVIGVVFGLVFLFIPDLFYNFITYPLNRRDPVAIRVLGVALIGLSSGSLIAAFENKWEEIRATLEMEVVFLLIGTIVVIYSHFFLGLPILAVFIDVILIIFLVGFLLFILKERQED
jgi:hypothetical protein